MSDLTDFLLARIAEDEAVAKRSKDSPLELTNRRAISGADAVRSAEAMVEHIARHDPARVLAECEAKRRIVEALVDAEDAVTKYNSDDPNNPPSYWQEWGNLHALRLAAESIADVYADHPDYDESWRP